jgi:hypothetical protein
MTDPDRNPAESNIAPAVETTIERQTPDGQRPNASHRLNMHQVVGLALIGLALPMAFFSQPITASLILCGVTSFSIGLLVKQSQQG